MLFCVHFKYNLKTTWYLQLYYTPSDSSTTDDALFHVKSGKAVATYKLHPCTNIAVQLFCVQVLMTTKPRAPTTVLCIKQLLSNQRCSFYKYKVKYDLQAAV